MSLKDFEALKAEITELNAKKAQIKAQTIVEIRTTMAAMDIDESELVDAKKYPGVIGPNGESWSGRGRKPLWLLAMEGKDVAATEPMVAAETDQADLVLPL